MNIIFRFKVQLLELKMSTVVSASVRRASVELEFESTEPNSSATIKSTGAGKRYSRSNTLEEKRKMRSERKKRRKSRIKAVEAHLSQEKALRTKAEMCYIEICLERGSFNRERRVWHVRGHCIGHAQAPRER